MHVQRNGSTEPDREQGASRGHREAAIAHPEFIGDIGLGRADITPPPGVFARTWGSSRHDVATGVHKPLYVTCVMFRSPESGLELYLVSADLSFWKSNAEEAELRSRMLAHCGLSDDQLIFHLTHTHSAPSTDPENAAQPGGHLIQAFRDKIVDQAVTAVEQSRGTAGRSCLTWAYGSCRLAHNRDQPLRTDAGVTTIVGLNPQHAADDTLLVGRIVDAEDNVRAVLVNYACHPVSLGGGNTMISPDYVGSMRELVEAQTGAEICAFFNGASGELTPRLSYVSDTRVADRNGLEIGYAVLQTLASMLPPQSRLAFDRVEESGAPLGRWSLRASPASRTLAAETASLKLRYLELPTLQEIDRRIEQSTDRYIIERLMRRRALRRDLGDGDSRIVSFPIWQLGRSIVVAVPAEPYSDFQLLLRRRYPDMAVAVLNIANGYLSYLPPKAAYDLPDLYQVRVALFEKGCMERTAEQAAKVMDRMAAGV